MVKTVLQFIADHLFYIGIALFAFVAYWNISKRRLQQRIARKILKKAVKAQMTEPITLHPDIDPAKCAGCGACTKVCPEGDILKMINHKAVLVSPTKCVGHGECEAACPFGAITLVFGTSTRGMDIPRLTGNYETNVPGLYIAGELGGMGLIRNAVKQGVLAARHALRNLDSSVKADVDLFIVGAGPAGLASALAAIAKKKKYVCVEQNSFGGTVANFPRQKVVMSHPADLPIVGKMKFDSNKVSKEQLLGYWNRIRKKTGMRISENEKFETLEKKDGRFLLKTSKGTYTARKVILAMGVRGTPRRLGLENEDLQKVTYNLLDPEQYQNQTVAIVGGGNAAAEAAQYLGKKNLRNKVTLLVRGPAFDRCNDENRILIEKMRDKKLVEIWFNSEVREIHPNHLKVVRNGQEGNLPNDYLFIFAGAEMPHKYLMGLGVQIEKKFGESLSKKQSKPSSRNSA